MRSNSTSGSSVILSLTLFLIGIVGALLTGTTALIVWLAGWIGVIYASLVVCALYLLLALCCYLFSLRRIVRRIARQLQTVSYVADLIEQGYDWTLRQCSMLLNLFQHAIEQLGLKTREPAE